MLYPTELLAQPVVSVLLGTSHLLVAFYAESKGWEPKGPHGMIRAMGSLKDNAVVLKRLDFSETSQVLAVLTREHGKVRIIAKGIKRSTSSRFSAGIDLLEAGHLVLSVKNPHQEALAILTEWKQSIPFIGLRSRIDRLYGAQYAAALTAALVEDWDPHPELFDALVALLHRLEGADDCLAAVIGYQRDLSAAIGSMPVLEACVACGQVGLGSGPIHFSSVEGGLLCRDCEGARTEKRLVQRSALAWLGGSSGPRDGRIGAYQTFDYHLSHLMGRRLTVGRMFLDVC